MLTLVMMAMFAPIFSMTGTIVTKQKGIGENDQNARILTTVLKTDLRRARCGSWSLPAELFPVAENRQPELAEGLLLLLRK